MPSPTDILRTLYRIAANAEYSSALLVYVCGAVLGARAQEGMTPVQWVCGLTAVGASIAVAVMVRCWPAPPSTRNA